MATNVLATGSTAASSSDITVAAGSFEPVFLKDATGPDVPIDVLALVEMKDSAGAYFTIGKMNRHQPAVLLTGPGVYRVTRCAGTTFGVDKGS
jgi:hypothetical protein